jgi:RNA polymerase sigma-70 factor (ECF subfamily)
VFVSAWQAWPRFRQESQAETWLTRITINHCRSQQRRRWLRDEIWERLARFVRVVDAQQPHEPLARRENDALVRHGLDQLPQRDREVLVLRYLEDLTVDDIAKTLELKRGAVEVRLTRARARLKQVLEVNERPRA